MHEIGHNFGLVPYRGPDVDYTHCTNTCVMRQGLRLPTDWINMANDRLKHGALCSLCEKDLKDFFKEKPSTSNGKPTILYHKRRD